jgi:hydroxymethylpyrimidine pyrophosphatase-like HAD family hydrolase
MIQCAAMTDVSKQNIIAMVYDFDGTLSPNNIQEDTIFRAYGINKEEFWAKANDLVVSKGYERTLSYLKLLLHDEPFRRNPLTREGLEKLADQIEYFPGVTDFFHRLSAYLVQIAEASRWGITLEHYIVSSGLKEILEASKVATYFKRIYACEYDYEQGKPVFPKIVINDTNKTQFLFRINKGKLNLSEDINSHMPDQARRIPFANMIYIGDGHTDIPSMTVMRKNGGHTIAVFAPDEEVSGEVAAMVNEGRADHFAPADFREGRLLERILKLTLKKISLSIAYRLSTRMSSNWIRDNKNPAQAGRSLPDLIE